MHVWLQRTYITGYVLFFGVNQIISPDRFANETNFGFMRFVSD